MLQAGTKKFLREYGSTCAPLFLALGVCLICCLPAACPKENFIDENAISVSRVPVITGMLGELHMDTRISQYTRVVRGRRSVGSESIAVYVNAAFESSVVLANHLIYVLREKENMACDTNFYFFNDTSKDWPIPDSFVRAAIVINVTSFHTNNLCFNVFGANGMQPNQDLFNLAVAIAEKWRFNIDVLCQNPYISFSTSRPIYEHYFLALQTALVAPLRYQPWYKMRSRGISLLAISTEKSERRTKSSYGYNMAAAHEQLIATLSYLHERFHHSTSVWIPLSVDQYVEYDVIQFATILFVASLLSTCYSIYEVEGFSFSPCAALVSATGLAALVSTLNFGTAGFFVSSGVLTVGLGAFSWDMSWGAINAVVLCLLIILQPVAGLVMGFGATLQLQFIHVRCRKWHVLLIGAILSWIVLVALTEVMKAKLFDTETTAGVYFSFFLYPNALWISSRLIRSTLGA
ncbi:GPI transamidase component GAA1 [Trypanosoma brucei brucei TREU927]|uniref:GPI transamidase component GAA1 n=1 Tax=Trypanosoma brucei brucei (strain 927/4 GUTat10.1) TaxID=185431 RepID=Q38CL7_TRYB2|nr:GPI transamidase component GAA1 [Trypanosoma brucei brucei TREU927]EAN77453.1 GPI transamidase component GAA1 [Trypanosoma brucei brucei TREU927]